jgi:S-(hydroxymethyl)glutathione dehydrogenase/alcohol dehydrogenase
MIPVGQTVTLMGAAFLGEKRIQGSLMGSNRFPVDMPRWTSTCPASSTSTCRQAEARRRIMISRRIKLEDGSTRRSPR